MFSRSASLELVPEVISLVRRVCDGNATFVVALVSFAQFFPLACVPLLYVIFPARFHNEFHLLVAFAWYMAAKVTEVRLPCWRLSACGCE